MKKLFICLYLIFSIQIVLADTISVSYAERPPYYNTVNGKATGFLIDLQKKIYTDANLSVYYISLPTKRIFKKIKNKNSIHCSGGWFKTSNREKFAKFTLPIYQNKPIVLFTTNQNSEKLHQYSSLEEIFSNKTLSLGQIEGFSYGTVIDNLIKKKQPKIYSIVGEHKQLIKMLAKKRISYILIPPEEIKTHVLLNNLNINDFTIISLPDIPVGNTRHIMCSKGVKDEIINKINKSITKLQSTRDYKIN